MHFIAIYGIINLQDFVSEERKLMLVTDNYLGQL